jgi:hypothetical protein
MSCKYYRIIKLFFYWVKNLIHITINFIGIHLSDTIFQNYTPSKQHHADT